MLCPIDQIELSMSDRQGIEIDFCPKCRGVWLDRGELDKIIERSGNMGPVTNTNEPAASYPKQEQHYDRDSRDNREDYGHKKHRKENFLGDLFDF